MEQEKSKEMEVNVDDSNVNKADLPKDDEKAKKGRGRGRRNKGGKQCGTNQSSTNDPSFYYEDMQTLNDMATIPFAYATGLPLQIMNNERWVNPGVRVLYTRPCLPLTKSADSSINAVANKQFAFFRATISSRLPYEAPDLIIYELAAGSFYSFINWCDRIYETAASMYVNENRYAPRTLLQVQGVNPDDVANNLSNFRAWINMTKKKIAGLSVPNTIKYFRREVMVYRYYYTEGPSVKDQLYMYAPLGFWQYQDNPGSGSVGSSLFFKQLIGNNAEVGSASAINDSKSLLEAPLLLVSDIMKYGNQMLAAIYTSEDIAVMSANILRAYGTSGIFVPELTPEFPTPIPQYDLNVLEQMQNATVMPENVLPYIGKVSSGVQQFDWGVRQRVSDVGSGMPATTYIEFDPGFFKPDGDVASFSDQYYDFLADRFVNSVEYILTSVRPDMTPDVILDITRGMLSGILIPDDMGDDLPDWYVSGCTEAVCFSICYQLPTQSNLVYNQLTQVGQYLSTAVENTIRITQELQTTGVDELTAEMQREAIKSVFKFCATEYVYTGTAGSAFINETFHGVNARLDNYGVVTGQDIEKMNELASFALFNINSTTKAY